MCESWNYRYSTLIGHRHPPIWKAIKFLKREEAVASTKLHQYSIGTLSKKQVKRVYIQLQLRLKNLCNEYNQGRMNMADFLRGVGHNIHLGEN